jgi:hypothetical protein
MAEPVTALLRDVPVNANARQPAAPSPQAAGRNATVPLPELPTRPAPGIIFDGRLSLLLPGDLLTGTLFQPENSGTVYISSSHGIFQLAAQTSAQQPGNISVQVTHVGRTVQGIAEFDGIKTADFPVSLTLVEPARPERTNQTAAIALDPEAAKLLAQEISQVPALLTLRQPGIAEKTASTPPPLPPQPEFENRYGGTGTTTLIEFTENTGTHPPVLAATVVALVDADQYLHLQSGPLAKLLAQPNTALLKLLPSAGPDAPETALLIRRGQVDSIVRIPKIAELTTGMHILVLLVGNAREPTESALRQSPLASAPKLAAHLLLLAHMFGLAQHDAAAAPAIREMLATMQAWQGEPVSAPSSDKSALTIPVSVAGQICPLVMNSTPPNFIVSADASNLPVQDGRSRHFDVRITYPVIGEVSIRGSYAASWLALSVTTREPLPDGLKKALTDACRTVLEQDGWAGTVQFSARQHGASV